MPIEAMTLTTSDGMSIEAELAGPADGEPVRAGMVICHPHPQFGGSMRSIVVSALFGTLPDAGVACLRFNFRGVEGSTGTYADGDGERLDARTAVDALTERVPDGAPLVMAGWSFGADVALSVHDPRIAAWLAIASPLRYLHDAEVVALDPRPKHLVLAERDEIRPPAEVQEEVARWTNTSVVVVGGASHFFVGSTDRLVVIARALVDELAGASPRSTA